METSITFGSTKSAASMAINLIIEMQYKLHYLGIPVEQYSKILCDNLPIIMNTTLPLFKI